MLRMCINVLYLSDVLQERSLVTAEFDPLRPCKAAAGLHPLLFERGQTSGEDSLPWNKEGGGQFKPVKSNTETEMITEPHKHDSAVVVFFCLKKKQQTNPMKETMKTALAT